MVAAVIGRFCNIVLLLVLVAAASVPAHAWDEVTHAAISRRAIDQVRSPALKAFLQDHYDEMESGVWFPDWGHALKPHGDHLHAEYLDAAWVYLQRPAVRAQKNYPQLLAYYMGAYGHVVEDRVLDATMKTYADEVGDADRDDMENGMMVIATYHRLFHDFRPYEPKEDLARIYASAGYFGEKRLNKTNLDTTMSWGMRQGEIKNRRLTELSFLTADWTRQKFPFAAANVETAPGGFNDEARAVAAAWEAIWTRAHGKPAPFFVYTVPSEHGILFNRDPQSALGRMLIVTSERMDIRDLANGAVRLSDGERKIPVRILPYIPEPGHERDVAFVVEAGRPWQSGGKYQLDIRHHDAAGMPQTLHLDLSMPAHPPAFAKPAREARPFAFGLWVGAVLLGMAGLIYGLADMGKLLWAAIRKRTPVCGWVFTATNAVFKTVSLGLVGLSVWMISTDAEWVIEYLRHHH